MRYTQKSAIVCFLVTVFLAGLSACGGDRALAPVRGSGTQAPKPIISNGSHSQSSHYRVQKGDTLYSIAWRTGKDYKYLAALNGIRYPYTIYVGQRLRLTGSLPRRSTRPAKSAPKRPIQVAGNTAKPVQKTDKNQIKAEVSSKKSKKILKLEWQWPITGSVVPKNTRHLPSKQGVEIAGSLGQIVRSAADGRVVYSGNGLIGYGNLVIVKHNEEFLSAYGYNRRLLVQEGDQVKRGQGIAEMGLGKSREAALYFEIRRNGDPVDPMIYLPR